ncbi:patatin-like phospholipase family protein [Gordonia zhaorongruii]|uniref:patatin-like phospholipase family protein n=1 Tax=Gordonia zhaorongruii TaxID=2597659 RepID=UPI001045E1D1|nr:patatin-like phospholipase family protein [Gordonia zhaorongruii]
MTTAFVLSGGANLGAIQVGMLAALAERGVQPDLLVGTSAGALNAGFIAGHGLSIESADELGEVWKGLSTWQIFPPRPRRLLNALLGRSPALFGDHGMRNLAERHLTFTDLEDARIPLRVIATALLTGDEIILDSGNSVEAILASSALPGLLPPVDHNGSLLVDGGVADNTAISPAIASGIDRIYILSCGYKCALDAPPTSVTGMLLQTMELLVHKRLIRDIREYSDDADLIVLPPPCPIDVGEIDFSRAAELIDRAYQDSRSFLDADGGRREVPADHIEFHAH